jgi:hypothetical protein
MQEIYLYSNPSQVYKNAIKFYNNPNIYFSDKPNKKYMILDPNTNKFVYFGQMFPGYEDYTKHKNKERRRLYLLRSENIKGNWKDNPYSPNNLSRTLLW